jgi:hypothetical protein
VLADYFKNEELAYNTILYLSSEIQMYNATYSRLIRFLQEDLAISAASIAVALRHTKQDPGPLPMILLQYGLITLEQLDQIYDWLETV